MEPPTTLSPEALARFKAIYLEEFGETLPDDAATEMALRVLRLFDLLWFGQPNDMDRSRHPQGLR